MEERKQFCRDKLGYTKPEEDRFLLTGIVYYLSGYYNAEVTAIHNDPGGWSGIAAESRKNSKNHFKTWIECDLIEDGFYLTFWHWWNHFKTDEIPCICGDDGGALCPRHDKA